MYIEYMYFSECIKFCLRKEPPEAHIYKFSLVEQKLFKYFHAYANEMQTKRQIKNKLILLPELEQNLLQMNELIKNVDILFMS